VTLEGLGRGELAQLVTDHRIVDEHRDMLPTVMDGESVTDEIGENGRTARPGLDDLLGAGVVLALSQLVLLEASI
jgi:hypothetical protein